MDNDVEIGNIGEEGCACGEVKGEGYRIEAHCHRTGQCRKCPFAGVHYDNEKGREHAEKIAEYIAEAYMCDAKAKQGLFRTKLQTT